MAKTITIELPDDLEQQLAVQANALNQPLEGIVLQTLIAVATQIQALQDANFEVRRNAAEALGRIGTEAAIPVLAQALNDENLHVRESVAIALRKIGTEAAILALTHDLPSESSVSSEYDPITPLIGTLHLGTTDLAEDHDRYIGEVLAQELNPSE